MAAISKPEREEAVKESRKISLILNVAAWVTGIWGLFYPHPYALTILVLVALPWISIVVVRRFHVRIDRWKREANPQVAAAFFMPSLVLLLRGVLDYRTLDWPRLGLYGSVVAVILCVSMALAERKTRKRPNQVVGFCVVAFFYGIGGVSLANGLLDPSMPAVYPTKIIDKRVLQARRTTYRLTLAPWGPRSADNFVEIPKETYDVVNIGDVVCPCVRKGALGVPWYEVSGCP